MEREPVRFKNYPWWELRFWIEIDEWGHFAWRCCGGSAWTLLLCHLLGTLNSDARKDQFSVNQQMKLQLFTRWCVINMTSINWHSIFYFTGYFRVAVVAIQELLPRLEIPAGGMGSWRQNHHSCHKGSHPYCKANSVSLAFIAGPIAHQVRINTGESYHLPAYWFWWGGGCQCLRDSSC